MNDLNSTGGSQRLDPLIFPLHGSRLIEASAGTGKTFTIALLYVRLILGHGDIAQTGRLLTPRDILVVTFTEAATKELRDRIRKRLAESAEIFRADPATVPELEKGQDLLHDLRASYDPAEWAGCAHLLQLAAESMDEAAVHTIHGWCNRMLKEHAFDSGGLFDQALETDQSELLGQVVRDYWRTFVNELDADTAEAFLDAVPSPDDLQGRVRELLKLQTRLPESAATPREVLTAQIAERRAVFDSVREVLQQQADDFLVVYLEAKKSKRVNGTKMREDRVRDWLDLLLEWSHTRDMAPPDLTDAAWGRLSAAGLEAAWKGPAPIDHPLIQSMAQLESQRSLTAPAEVFWLHAARWVGARLEREKQRRGEMGFDDLLTRLDSALQKETGARLTATIRQQFPVAMIDEFQDTDPVQYRIFDSVYQVADNVRERGFFMIGDPKQAIYRFRGADIFTYLAARSATEGRHVTLPRNFRSSADQVSASNRVFAFAEDSRSQGAFLFRRGQDRNPLPFIPVEAQGRRDELRIDGKVPAAMTFWSHINSDNKGQVEQKTAEACASEVVRLLNLGVQRRAGFGLTGDAAGELRPLCSADIAILVNKGAEARLIRNALSERGVKSVYLSDRASVLDTRQALDLLRWLEACAEPERDRLVRAALATATLDLGWARLDELRRNELAWEDEIERFRRLRIVWREQGVLAMIRRILVEFGVPGRLLQANDGERALTDVLHIAELLQRESQQVDGEQALIRRLGEMISEAGREVEALQVRLESDADLVQVVTVHKSKGLEYPLVFLPFATSCRPASKKDSPLMWHDENGELKLTFRSDDDSLALADQERLGEDIRKLYVALTRARYATWVGAPDIKGEERRSALGYLAGLDGSDSLADCLQAMAAEEPAMTVSAMPPITIDHYQPPPAPPLAEALRPQRAARAHWWIASYSAIRYHAEQPPGSEASEPAPGITTGVLSEPETPAAERLLEEAEGPRAAATRPVRHPHPEERRIHGFYRGAEPGTFLHGLLEWCAESGFAGISLKAGELDEMLAQRCGVRGWEAWAGPLGNWLADMIDTPLQLPLQPDGSRPSLALSELRQAVPEMEFWFASQQVDTRALDRVVRQYTLTDSGPEVVENRRAAEPMLLNGMLKGFIDLVFEHEGRYYVADYKSNYIGPDDSDYTAEAMAAVVAEKRYDLQYALYMLALHRLLKARLRDYDYDRHVGGAVYLFLRGNGAPGGGVHSDRPDRRMIEALDRLFRGNRPVKPGAAETEALR
ncbi:exodeoxyribonuclease V subunit beta [Marinobacter sp.]|uniref:exodeoxyribonuclease V subunit beta n=1 Tax=Marinobacter sp. TaxID=50741 RepID=UPI00384FE785